MIIVAATIEADANPEKRLFISLLTRDIPMIAALLDLIDNSVNAAVEPFAGRLETADGYVKALNDESLAPSTGIRLDISSEKIVITDTAPGISSLTAQKHVFKFGRSENEENESDRLSVYGLGLKRAIFKLGNKVHIVSDHVDGGFEMFLDVAKWAKDPRIPWKFDLTEREPVPPKECGTRISVTELYPETSRRVSDGLFIGQLKESIARTYSFFLAKFVNISVGEDEVKPANLQCGKNIEKDRLISGEVSCAIAAGLGIPEGGRFKESSAGWHVFCNGRAVVHADKSSLTGWDNNGLPSFQPKHRPFLGTVFFVSKHAEMLPWDTTKSRINDDSGVWQEAKRLMVAVGRPVVTFLDSRYSEEGTSIDMKELSEASQGAVSAMQVSTSKKATFVVPKRPAKTTTRIQFDAKDEHIESIARFLMRPSMSGSDVGRHTFNYFLRNEVGED